MPILSLVPLYLQLADRHMRVNQAIESEYGGRESHTRADRSRAAQQSSLGVNGSS